MPTILIVEDEENYRDPLAFSLRREGFEVLTAATGTAGLEMVRTHKPDLLVLDLMLPGLSGTEVCREIRGFSSLPIIMATAKDDVVDTIVGLEIGADDYLTKPYEFRELLARIRAVLRRTGGADEPAEKLEVGPVAMDVEAHEVRVSGKLISLPLREFELLEIFLRNPGRVLTRGQIIDRVWGSGWVGDPKTLDVHVKRLRSKIEADPAQPQLVVTVRGLGYKIVPPQAG